MVKAETYVALLGGINVGGNHKLPNGRTKNGTSTFVKNTKESEIKLPFESEDKSYKIIH